MTTQSEKDAEMAETTEEGSAEAAGAPAGRQVSVSLRSLALGALLAGLVVAVGVLGWLYAGARSELGQQAQRASDEQHARQVALDYAVGAAEMDFRDLGGWKTRLVAGTSPELAARLGEAADSMEQILVPLQWQSTARPVAAVVRSSAGGVLVVDAFVSVLTKTTQAPQGLQSTATYSMTLGPSDDWRVTDVGGIDAVMRGR